MFNGSIVALVTPWRNNKLDRESLQALIKWHEDNETSAIVLCGSTGEGALLTHDERQILIDTAVQSSHLPIIVGCGGVSTQAVIDQAQQAENLKADALLIVTPFYSKPTQEGIYQHFKSIHDVTNIPIIAYNNAGRTNVDITIPTMLQLFNLSRIVGLKDSTYDVSRAAQLRAQVTKPVSLLSGDDPLIVGYLAQGGDGFISITANVAPKLMSQLFNAWKTRDIHAMQQLNKKLMPLHLALITEPNPIPVKYAVSLLKKCSNELRLPLMPASDKTQKHISYLMEQIIGTTNL